MSTCWCAAYRIGTAISIAGQHNKTRRPFANFRMNEEAVGWMAALGAMLAFGSFGVPIKSDAANSVNVDPLVFQSYKSGVCFLTSWLILLKSDVPFSFTPWGIVSCLFWVPGGVATVFAIRNAGLAIAIGVGGSSIVLVSFAWGIFIFQEPIHSKWGASLAVAMMMAGLAGMSYYSSPTTIAAAVADNIPDDGAGRSDLSRTDFVSMTSRDEHGGDESQQERMVNDDNIATEEYMERRLNGKNAGDIHATMRTEFSESLNSANSNEHNNDNGEELFQDEHDDAISINSSNSAVLPQQQQHTMSQSTSHHDPLERLYVCGIPLTRRQLGISGALFNGIWGGSIMAPMKFAKASSSGGGGNTQGVHYLISFGIGAAVVTTALWVVRWTMYVVQYQGNMNRAYQALPSFHWKTLWRAGGMSGLLWSVGNFFSLISVHYLGEGVGYSVVQAGMLGMCILK